MPEKPTVMKGRKALWRQGVCFLVCLMLMLVVPFWRDRKVIGLELPDKNREEKVETLTPTPTGYVVNTTDIGKDIMGYRSTTPVEITVEDGVITKITPLPNQETPEFFGAVRNSDLFESLDGKTLEEAAGAHIDGVSGATFTSNAVIANIKTGVAYALDQHFENVQKGQVNLDAKFWLTLAVILAGGIIPWFVKSRKYRLVQLALNIGVLGFWGGTFLCYSLMTGYLANGIHSVLLIPTVLMLVAAFIFPFFGKKNHYCLWMCPYGSLQELLAKCIKFKATIPFKVLKWLDYFRMGLWFVLMWLLWTGLCFDWMGLEPFAAFFFKDASLAVLIIAGAFLLLSLVINRPYCRFVCPTGTLFKYAEGSF